jgi:hypothetical protein
MASGTQTTVIFLCQCGLGYSAAQERTPELRSGKFNCAECKTAVHSWSGVYDYRSWKPIRLKPEKKKGPKLRLL